MPLLGLVQGRAGLRKVGSPTAGSSTQSAKEKKLDSFQQELKLRLASMKASEIANPRVVQTPEKKAIVVDDPWGVRRIMAQRRGVIKSPAEDDISIITSRWSATPITHKGNLSGLLATPSPSTGEASTSFAALLATPGSTHRSASRSRPRTSLSQLLLTPSDSNYDAEKSFEQLLRSASPSPIHKPKLSRRLSFSGSSSSSAQKTEE